MLDEWTNGSRVIWSGYVQFFCCLWCRGSIMISCCFLVTVTFSLGGWAPAIKNNDQRVAFAVIDCVSIGWKCRPIGPVRPVLCRDCEGCLIRVGAFRDIAKIKPDVMSIRWTIGMQACSQNWLAKADKRKMRRRDCPEPYDCYGYSVLRFHRHRNGAFQPKHKIRMDVCVRHDSLS